MEHRGKRNPTISEYLEEWWPRGGSSIRQRKLLVTNIQKFMGDKIDWPEVDESFYFRMCVKMDGAGFSTNYKRKLIGQLKSVMEEGRKMKYHHVLDYKDWRVVKEYPDMIYLTQDEVDAVWNVELKNSMERKAHDLFINGGVAPQLSNQKFNDAIKKVCKAAGICSMVEVRKGAKAERKEKYKLVASHTARRTGATLLRLNGASMREIMLIGGWESEQTLERYLRITKEENAVKMRDNPFFK